MNNTRFSTAMHILTLLYKSSNVWVTSDWIAGSININAAIVRKEISVLRNAGLVISKQGKEGGSQLGKSPDSITLADVFITINESELLGKKNQNPNPNCPVGIKINEELDSLYHGVDRQVIDFLKTKTVKDFGQKFD
ncbi:Rrf2 family transcriptional regulator [Chryseobacterium sp. T1]